MKTIRVKAIRSVRANAIDYILVALIALFIGFSLGQVMQTTKLGAEAQTLRREIAVLRAEQERIRLVIESSFNKPQIFEEVNLPTYQ